MQELIEGETVNVSGQKCCYIWAVLITVFFMRIVIFKNGWPRRCRF